MKRQRNVKIVATLGPASDDYETIKALHEAGADVFRLNMSHGSHEEIKVRHEIIRRIEAELKSPIAILADLQGPKLRVGVFANDSEELVEGAAFRYSGRHVCSDATEPGTSKTCGCCGWWHAQLGGHKKFRCESCGVRMDRDVNGARNNFLAYLGSRLDVGWDGVVVPPAAVNGH